MKTFEEWMIVQGTETARIKDEEPEQVKCRGCEKMGEPNYHSQGKDDPADEYWCGGSPWCCP